MSGAWFKVPEVKMGTFQHTSMQITGYKKYMEDIEAKIKELPFVAGDVHLNLGQGYNSYTTIFIAPPGSKTSNPATETYEKALNSLKEYLLANKHWGVDWVIIHIGECGNYSEHSRED